MEARDGFARSILQAAAQNVRVTEAARTSSDASRSARLFVKVIARSNAISVEARQAHSTSGHRRNAARAELRQRPVAARDGTNGRGFGTHPNPFVEKSKKGIGLGCENWLSASDSTNSHSKARETLHGVTGKLRRKFEGDDAVAAAGTLTTIYWVRAKSGN